MRKALPLLIALSWYSYAIAQYCGHIGRPSDSSQCICTLDSSTAPGVYPTYKNLPPLVNGQQSDVVIQIRNFDTIEVNGGVLTLLSLRIDSIANLPEGICWNTNKPNNTFNYREPGCIKFSGITCSTPGQYRLKFLVTPTFNVQPVIVDYDLFYVLRVKNDGDTDIPVDSNQMSVNPFIPYGNSVSGCLVAINRLDETRDMSIFPNPATTHLNIALEQTPPAPTTFQLYDVTGRMVLQKPLAEKTNTVELDGLGKGMYLYSIVSKGEKAGSGKVIIE